MIISSGNLKQKFQTYTLGQNQKADVLFGQLFKKQYFSFFFFRAVPKNMEIPRRGAKSELQLPAYATATVTQDPSCVCDLYHSSWQHRALNPQSKARDQTRNLRNTSQIHFCCATMRTPQNQFCVNTFSWEGFLQMPIIQCDTPGLPHSCALSSDPWTSEWSSSEVKYR